MNGLIQEKHISGVRYALYLRFGCFYLVKCCNDQVGADEIIAKGTLSECQAALNTISVRYELRAYKHTFTTYYVAIRDNDDEVLAFAKELKRDHDFDRIEVRDESGRLIYEL